MFRIGICDDEATICTEIESIILEYSKTCLETLEVETFSSGEELCEYMKTGKEFDLLFLDIELKLMNGVEVGKFIRNELKNEEIFIVYISARDNYYDQLFDIRPMHFLHKPLETEKVIGDIEKAMELSGRLEKSFTYNKSYELYKKEIKKILYFEAKGRKIRIVTRDGEDLFYGKLKDVFSRLEKYRFLFIHQSYLVNHAHIIMFTHTEITVTNNDILPISRQKKEEVLATLVRYTKGRK